MKSLFVPTLPFLLNEHFWLEHNGKIGRLTPQMAVFTQRAALENVFRGNGNRSKRRLGINPEHNRMAPWLGVTWQEKLRLTQ